MESDRRNLTVKVVQRKPKVIYTNRGSLPSDDPHYLTCIVDAFPQATVRWYKHTAELWSNQAFNILESVQPNGNLNATLHMLKWEEQNEGNYTCVAKNSFGVHNATFELTSEYALRFG